MLIKNHVAVDPVSEGTFDTEVISVTKGFGSLLIGSTREPYQMDNERISVYVEKSTGNKYIAQDVLLKDFIALTTHGEDAVHYHDDLHFAMCELTEDGGFIDLAENETIKIQLSKLRIRDNFALYGFEEPLATTELSKFERKIMASETLTQDIDVKGYDLMSLERNKDVQEIQFTFDNSTTTTCLPIELESFCRSLDASTRSNDGLQYSGIHGRFIVPLKGIVNVKIKKDAGQILNIHLRIDESDWNLYQRNK